MYRIFVDLFCFFFSKHKTVYEVRISDWSSDVCSSDLRPLRPTVAFHEQGHCQEDWRRCGRQSDADPHVTALRETPFEGSTYIVEARKVWRALLSGRIGRPGTAGLLDPTAIVGCVAHRQVGTLGVRDRKSTRLHSSH